MKNAINNFTLRTNNGRKRACKGYRNRHKAVKGFYDQGWEAEYQILFLEFYNKYDLSGRPS